MTGAVVWYVVSAVPRREADAAVDLKAQGYAVFFPRHWETRTSRRHTTTELRCMFPGYLFAAVDSAEHQSVRAINEADHVIGVVIFGGTPATIREHDMWQMRRYFDPDGVLPPGARSLKHLRKVIREKVVPKMPGLDLLDVLARIDRLDDAGRFRIRSDSTGDVGASRAASVTSCPDSSAWSAGLA